MTSMTINDLETYSSGDCPGFSPDSLLSFTAGWRQRHRRRGKCSTDLQIRFTQNFGAAAWAWRV